MRSETSRKQRMACCNEVCVSVLLADVRARVVLVLCVGSCALFTYCTGLEHSAGAVCACVRACVTMCNTYHTGAVLSSQQPCVLIYCQSKCTAVTLMTAAVVQIVQTSELLFRVLRLDIPHIEKRLK
jgi:hypothetical protein